MHLFAFLAALNMALTAALIVAFVLLLVYGTERVLATSRRTWRRVRGHAPAQFPTVSVVPRVAVSFLTLDGGLEVKRLFVHSLAPTLTWRRRHFRRIESPTGTYVFREVQA